MTLITKTTELSRLFGPPWQLCSTGAAGQGDLITMKFLCLAYGDEEGWGSLSESAKQEVLAQDEVIRNRGNFRAEVKSEVTAVKNWDRNLETASISVIPDQLPLAGFSIIGADNVDEVTVLVSNTPCARANVRGRMRGRKVVGYIEIRPIWELGD